MATIGRSRAIAWARGIKMSGFVAWLAWLFIHVFYLIGFRNRISVLLNWTWSYFFWARGARLITATGWHAGDGDGDAPKTADGPKSRRGELLAAPVKAPVRERARSEGAPASAP
jgi:NADH dehydrogenase